MKLILLLIIFWRLVPSVIAVQLEWDRNSESNLLGYRVYWGAESRNYTSVFDVGNTNSVTLPTLPGTTYYAVTAYDTDLLESDFSDEVSLTKPNAPPRPPLNLRIRATNAVSQIRLLQNTGLNQNYWRETGVAFVPVTNGMVFYQAAAPASAIQKSFMSARPSKGAMTAPPQRRVIGPPPIPP